MRNCHRADLRSWTMHDHNQAAHGYRKAVTATFLRAQAWLGLGNGAKARELLYEVRVLDRNHSRAADMLAALEGARGPESGLRCFVDTNTRHRT
jgi:hypothetical protein